MSAKRIILMYISEVSGHHSATVAIEKAIRILEPHAVILNINAFNYTNPISEKIVNRLYIGVIKRTPKIWHYLYDNPRVVKNLEKIKGAIHRFNSIKLKRLFDRFNPDVIVCTQAFPCGMVADFKKYCDFNIPLVAVLTDYIPHSYWIYDTIDYYVVPAEEVASRLIEKGVAPDKVKTMGIPVDPKFNTPVDKNKIIQKFKLDPHLSTVMIMGGGQGIGPIKTIIKSLEKLKSDFQEIVITGTNKRLHKSLKRRIKRYKKKILLLGYVDYVNELMGIADIVITKPGGVTTAEALAKKLPMVIVKPIPGQEASNTAYLTAKGAAVRINRAKEISIVLKDLLENPDKLKSLRKSAGRISKPNASIDIARLLLGL